MQNVIRICPNNYNYRDHNTTLSVSDSAFIDETKLICVDLPNCKHIGESSFQGCTSLSSITLPACQNIMTKSFFNCSRLSSFSFDLCEYIGPSAFNRCTSLSNLTIGPKCSLISDYAFDNCSNISILYLTTPPSLLTLRQGTHPFGSSINEIYVNYNDYSGYKTHSEWSEYFNKLKYENYGSLQISFKYVDLTGSSHDSQILLPYAFLLLSYDQLTSNIKTISSDVASISQIDDVTEIASERRNPNEFISFGSSPSFENSKISSITLLSCQSIPNSGLSGCNTLKNAHFPNCTIIHNHAFRDCTSLTSIDIPNCELLGYSAFRNDKKLKTISLPKCRLLGAYAFVSCTSLTQCSVQQYDGNILSSTFSYCSKLSSVYIELTHYRFYIEHSAFKACKKLKNLPTIKREDNYYIDIKNNAFISCTSLTAIKDNNGHINTIGEKAFKYCSMLSSVNAPAAECDIYSFYDCPALTSFKVFCLHDGAIFNNSSHLKDIYLYVDDSNVNNTNYVHAIDNADKLKYNSTNYRTIHAYSKIADKLKTLNGWKTLSAYIKGDLKS